jgi:branched-chain amino acid transport system ATP-binding protein
VAGLLSASGISVAFEGVKALDDVSLSVTPKTVEGLIGPNGAGKTTLVNVLSGFQEPDSGSVIVDGEDITDRTPEQRAHMGVVRTFQGSRSFGDLTVAENAEVSGVGLGLSRREAAARARDALDAVGIAERADARAADLTTGQERRLQVARVIAMRPRYLFLDEPTAGLNEAETQDLVEVIAGLPGELGCGILLIDHDMSVIMRACASIVVVDQGRVLMSGTPDEVRTNQQVIDAYLGS